MHFFLLLFIGLLKQKMVNQKFRHAFIHLFCGFLVTTFGLFVLFQKPILRKSSIQLSFRWEFCRSATGQISVVLILAVFIEYSKFWKSPVNKLNLKVFHTNVSWWVWYLLFAGLWVHCFVHQRLQQLLLWYQLESVCYLQKITKPYFRFQRCQWWYWYSAVFSTSVTDCQLFGKLESMRSDYGQFWYVSSWVSWK